MKNIYHLIIVFSALMLLTNFSYSQCASGATSAVDSRIDNVVLIGESITLSNNTTGSGCQTYSDFRGAAGVNVPDLAIGNSYTISVTSGTCGNDYSKEARVFIDWNNDLDFNDAGEALPSYGPNTAVTTYNMGVTVPGTAVAGTVTMRVITTEGSAPVACGSYQWGETEDYYLTIVSAGCTPAGACGGGSAGQSDYISNIQIGTINNASGCSPYTDYTAMSTNVNVSSSYLLTVNALGGLAYTPFTDCAGWVDWNADGDFLDANETLSFYGNGTPGPFYALVTVPVGTALGAKTLRVRTAEGGTTLTSCNTTPNGEVEDYTLNVNTNIAPTLSVSITEGVSGSICQGSSLTLNSVPVSSGGAITSYRWFYQGNNTSEVDADIDASVAGNYMVIVENASNEAASATYDLTVLDLPNGGILGQDNFCPPETIDLTLDLVGNGPFNIVYEPGGGTMTNVSDGDPISIAGMTTDTMVYLTQITDANGCVSNLNPTVNNELVNGDGTSLAGWTITNNGGNGWNANGVFRTSYEWARKYQVIDLIANGYSAAYLDGIPPIYASENYRGFFNCNDNYELTVTLEDAANNPLETRTISTIVGSCAWQTASFVFTGYPAGVRYIRFEHGGDDVEWWLGHYGTQMDNSRVTIGAMSGTSTGLGTHFCPLPVELLSFEAELRDRKVDLLWTTLTEVNNDYFSIERSMDGISWEKIGEVDGAGNSQDQRDYTYVDNSPYSGVSYYRLKQTDYDGSYAYSEIRSVNMVDVDQVQIAPNPTTGKIVIKGSAAELSSLRIINSIGQDITGQLQVQTLAESARMIDLSHLPKGIYIVKTMSEAHFVAKH